MKSISFDFHSCFRRITVVAKQYSPVFQWNKGACGSLRLAFLVLSVCGTSGRDTLCARILRETQMPFTDVFCVVHGGVPRETSMPFV